MKRLIVFALLFYCTAVLSQENNKTQIAENKVKYYQDFLSFKGEGDKTRLDVFIQVPYNAVQFIKTGQGFEAAYTVTVSVFDEEKKNLITEKIWNEKIVAVSFELTASPEDFNLGHRSFELPPGTYTVRTSILDKDSKNEYSSEMKINVKNFNASPLMSDIMFVAKRTQVDGNSKIVPNVSRNIVSDRDALNTFLEVYIDSSATVVLDYEILDEKDTVVDTEKQIVELKSGSNQIFNSIDSLKLNLGKYLLKVSLKDQTGKTLDATTKGFVSRWIGVPASMTDLDKSVDQLVYIASPEDLSNINSAEDRQEKAKRFVAFWKKQDPNPADEYNPIFNEYYNRVAYSNENFSTYSLEGWKSDRGMVLIILGAPDNIDRHPFEYYSKPYEVWQYYNLNRSFIFVDNSGFGDYRLSPETPLYGDLYRFRY